LKSETLDQWRKRNKKFTSQIIAKMINCLQNKSKNLLIFPISFIVLIQEANGNESIVSTRIGEFFLSPWLLLLQILTTREAQKYFPIRNGITS
jgi:hypothetical protein